MASLHALPGALLPTVRSCYHARSNLDVRRSASWRQSAQIATRLDRQPVSSVDRPGVAVHRSQGSSIQNVTLSQSLRQRRSPGGSAVQASTDSSNAVAEAFQATLPCGECDGKGWVVCSFCEGQKVNVQARGNKMYRRCPECKAYGVQLCPKCKVYKCVTLPGGELD